MNGRLTGYFLLDAGDVGGEALLLHRVEPGHGLVQAPGDDAQAAAASESAAFCFAASSFCRIYLRMESRTPARFLQLDAVSLVHGLASTRSSMAWAMARPASS